MQRSRPMAREETARIYLQGKGEGRCHRAVVPRVVKQKD